MTRYFLLIVLFLVSVLTIQSCKKSSQPEPDNPWGLPNATQEGKNIFACRVNGENWISERGIRNMGGGVTDSTFGIHGRTYENTFLKGIFAIGIISNDIISGKTFKLDDSIKRYGRYTSAMESKCFISNGGYGSFTAYSFDGELTLSKVDTVNKILSGTFWFNILTDYCDTMKVTDGRFDINYY